MYSIYHTFKARPSTATSSVSEYDIHASFLFSHFTQILVYIARMAVSAKFLRQLLKGIIQFIERSLFLCARRDQLATFLMKMRIKIIIE